MTTSSSSQSTTRTRNGILFGGIGGVLLVILYCCWRRIRYHQKKARYQIAREVSHDDPDAESWRVLDIPPGPSWWQVLEHLEQTDSTTTSVTQLCARWVRQYGKVFQISSSSDASSNPLWTCLGRGNDNESSSLAASIVVIADATCTKNLLCQHQGVGKSRYWTNLLANSFGSSILTNVDKDEWHGAAIRRALSGFLAVNGKSEQSNHSTFVSFMVEAAQRICTKMASAMQQEQQQRQLEPSAHDKTGEWKPVELLPYVEEYTLHALWFLLFGRDFPFQEEEEEEANVRRIREMALLLLRQVCRELSSLGGPQWWQQLLPCTAAWKRLQEKRRLWRALDSLIRREVQRLVAEASRSHPPAAPSVVARILQQESRFAATSAGLDALVEEVRVLFLLGYQTTHAAVAFAAGIVAERSDIRQEIAKQAAPREEEDADAAPIRLSATARHVVLESLRLYPVVPVLVAQVLDERGVLLDTDDPQVSYKAPPGTLLIFPTRVMQCDPQYYCSVGIPHSFPTSADPGRWFSSADEEHKKDTTTTTGEHPTPFLAALGLGEHACPASALVLRLGEVWLSVLAQRFEFSAKKPTRLDKDGGSAAATSQKSAVLESHLRFEETLLLRPQNGLPIWLRERQKQASHEKTQGCTL